jgi:hypothetical protein
VRPFKGIFCHDISEFESYMPSHAVQSLCAVSGLVKTSGAVESLAAWSLARSFLMPGHHRPEEFT